MRITVVRIICGIIVSSFIFSGCANKAPEETMQSEVAQNNESSASESGTSETPKTETGKESRLDEKWLERVRDLYVSKVPEQDRFATIYVDGLRGHAAFHPDFNAGFSFQYSALTGTQYIRLNLLGRA